MPFGRQTSREALEETTRSIKSSLTEGSSRIFGSVMGAKRGLIGGITSTFDQVVNIVGGSEEAEGGSSVAGAAEAQPPRDGAQQQQQPPMRPKPKPPKPPAPVTRQRSDIDVNGTVKQCDGGRVSRQNTVPVGCVVAQTAAAGDECPPTETTSGPPDFADGKQRRKIDAKPPLKRRNTNPFMDDYDPAAVEPDYAAGGGGPPAPATAGGGGGVPLVPDVGHSDDTGSCGVKVAPTQRYSEPSEAWNSRDASGPPNSSDAVSSLLPGIPNIVRGRVDEGGGGEGGRGCAASSLSTSNRDLLAMTPTSGASLPDPQILPERRRQATDSDADSEGTEGCDDQLDEEDQLAAADEDATGGVGGGGLMLKSGSRNSDQSWGCSGGGEDEGMDAVSAECIEFMKYFVQKIFDPT